MDSDQQYTPQKLLNKQHFKISSPATFKFLSQHQQNSRIVVTPQSKFLHSTISKTPGSIKKPTSNNSTTISSNNSTAYHIFPILNTPPSHRTRFTKVLNPFEAALTDRLHLPLICSPSLFQRPATPQHSSTQFEWTIEDVSSLGPANVEPHETQFLGDYSLDPDIEAKAQAAISSYFKEQQIVPSPQNCPLRNQRIILAETSNNNNSILMMQSPIIKPTKRIRDGYTQTILTLPPRLPLELENILKPFFNFNENQQQGPSYSCDMKSNNMSIDYEARDASLRRKLFDIPNFNGNNGGDNNTSDDDDGLISCNEFSPPPKTPELEKPLLSLNHSNDSLDKSSFGALSPISKLISPSRKFTKKYSSEEQQQSGLQNSSFLDQISPIKSSSPTTTTQLKNNSPPIIFIKKSSSPCKNKLISFSDHIKSNNQCDITTLSHSIYKIERNNSSPDLTRMSVDFNFNGSSIKNLIVHNFLDLGNKINNNNNTNDDHLQQSEKNKQQQKSSSQQQNKKSLSDVDIFNQSGGNYFDDDVMQVSQLSTKSASSTSSINDTPRRRRSVGRKNLSQSFSCHYSDTEEDVDDDDDNCEDNNNTGGADQQQTDKQDVTKPLVKRRSSPNYNENNILFLPKTKTTASIIKEKLIVGNGCNTIIGEITKNSKTNFYRTDSGFNEMSTNTQDDIQQFEENLISNKENITKYSNLKNLSSNDEISTKCQADISINQDVSMICCSTPSKRMEFL